MFIIYIDLIISVKRDFICSGVQEGCNCFSMRATR